MLDNDHRRAAVQQRLKDPQKRVCTSSGCRPMVGSSKTKTESAWVPGPFPRPTSAAEPRRRKDWASLHPASDSPAPVPCSTCSRCRTSFIPSQASSAVFTSIAIQSGRVCLSVPHQLARFPAVTGAAAFRAGNLHIRQELHVQADDPRAVADRAAEPARCCRKNPRPYTRASWRPAVLAKTLRSSSCTLA